jgi:hypothetical protein
MTSFVKTAAVLTMTLFAGAEIAGSEPELKPGNNVVVTQEGAEIMVGSEVRAVLKKGDEVRIMSIKGEWIGVAVQGEGEVVTGWLNAKYLAEEQAGSNRLRVKLGPMERAKVQTFSSSMAFWVYDSMLVLVFRNFDAPVTKYDVKPPQGGATLIVMIRKGDPNLGFARVTPGTYSPGIVRKGIIWPKGVLVLFKDDVELFGVGVLCHVNVDGTPKTNLGLGKDMKGMTESEVRAMFENLGTVRLTEVGAKPGGKVVGELSLGGQQSDYLVSGAFRVPVVETPEDF